MATDLRKPATVPKAQLAKVERPEKFSNTALGKADTCLHSFYLYCKHRGGPQNHRMAAGECWHEFQQRYVQMLMDSGEQSAPPEIGKDLMNAVISERKDLVLPTHEQHALRGMAWNYSHATVIDPNSVLGLEQMIELEIEDWTIRGQLDFCAMSQFGYMVIEDAKSGLYVMSQDEAENGPKGWQSWFYPLLAAEGIPEGESFPLGKGVEEFRFRFTFQRFTNSETGEILYREVVRTRDELHDFRNTLVSLLERIDHGFETGEFPASPGSHCNLCPARSECPIPEQFHEIEAIETLEEAQQALELHLTRDSQQRRLMRSVKAFAENYEEPIYVGDLAYDFQHRETRDWKKAMNGGGLIDPDKVPIKHSTNFAKRKQTPEEREAANA